MALTTLNRDQFLNRKPQTFVCKLADGTEVACRRLTETQFSEFSAWHFNSKGEADPKRLGDRRARLVAMSMLAPDGSLMFGNHWEDIKEVDSRDIGDLFMQISEAINLESRLEEQAPEGN